MKVFVYWNLHKKCWSVRHKGKVIAHADYVCLKDVEWHVNENGRQRVIAKRKKEVHAGAKGTLEFCSRDGCAVYGIAVDSAYATRLYDPAKYVPYSVTYNPYRTATFINRLTNEPVFKSSSAYLTDSRDVFAFN